MTKTLSPQQRLKIVKGLALEGGGMLGNAHVGVIEAMYKVINPMQLTHFAGASAGSFVAAALANRASVAFIKKILSETDFSKFKDDSWGVIRDLFRLDREYGWHKGTYMEKWYQGVLKKLTGNADITFAQSHAKYKTYLGIPITEVFKTHARTIYADHETAPDMTIWKAVTQSARIPVFFKASFQDGIPRVDGGTYDNYPIAFLYRKLPKDVVLGIKLISDGELYDHTVGGDESLEAPDNFINFIEVILETMHEKALKIHVHKDDWLRTIKVKVRKVSPTNFSMSKKIQDSLLKWGGEGFRKFVKGSLH